MILCHPTHSHTQQTFSLPRSHVPTARAKTGDGIIECNVSGKVLLKSNKECINSVLNSHTYILCFKTETKNIYKHFTTSWWCGKHEIKKRTFKKKILNTCICLFLYIYYLE